MRSVNLRLPTEDLKRQATQKQVGDTAHLKTLTMPGSAAIVSLTWPPAETSTSAHRLEKPWSHSWTLGLSTSPRSPPPTRAEAKSWTSCMSCCPGAPRLLHHPGLLVDTRNYDPPGPTSLKFALRFPFFTQRPSARVPGSRRASNPPESTSAVGLP